jgi:hypothetical protein
LEQESKLAKLVKEYIALREDLPDEVALKKEASGTLEERSKKFWKHLTPEEQESRREADVKLQAETAAKKEAKAEKEEAAFNIKSEEGKIQHVLDATQVLVNKKLATELAVKKLTPEEKLEIFSNIRYSFM